MPEDKPEFQDEIHVTFVDSGVRYVTQEQLDIEALQVQVKALGKDVADLKEQVAKLVKAGKS